MSAVKKARTVASEEKCINTIRVLSADVVEKAKSGHPGAPMGMAPIAHMLWSEVMNYNPANPNWANRDRFVLSNGHACALLYSMLHLSGYAVSVDDLKQFRQENSITPGHPENFCTPGVEVSTGPLGQGICNAIGMAMAEKHLEAVYGSAVVNHHTYVLCGDGCLQEGVSSEASSLAGHLGLGKLIVFYDDNKITIDGDTSLSFTEDVAKRYEAYNWHVQTVDDVNDLAALRAATQAAQAETNRPSIIKVRTIIGHGSSKQGSHKVHGAPLGKDDLAAVKAKWGFDPEASFSVANDVYDLYRARGAHGAALENAWNAAVNEFSRSNPSLAAEFSRRLAGELPPDLMNVFPTYSSDEPKAAATRNRSEESLNALAAAMPEIFGGSADLTPSNLTLLKCSSDFQSATPAGRYVRFGIREHGMAAICNGIFAHGGVRPYCATFLNFIGYALGSVRLSALSRFGVIYVMTHDSIGLGEDGPTHQPIEMMEGLRAIPNLLTFRPCDGNETAGAYYEAAKHLHTPSVLAFSRQAVPTLPHSSAAKVSLGAYPVHWTGESETSSVSIILVSTGTEVSLAVKVADALAANDHINVRVVSMPCMELFDQQSMEYQLSVFPENVPVMSIEPMSTTCWLKYAHATYGLDIFGASAPIANCYNRFGFTVENLSAKAKEVIAYYKGHPVQSKLIRHRFPVVGASQH